MKEQQDYTRDLEAIRSMMERSTKFPSLSGWTGIMAGLYALIGAHLVYNVFEFRPDSLLYSSADLGSASAVLQNVIITAAAVLLLAAVTAVVLTNKKASKEGEKVWNAASRRLLVNLAVPFSAGALFIAVLLFHGMIGPVIPLSLLFYGIALYGAGKFTEDEVRVLGLIQIGLGLLSAVFTQYSVIIWAVGFGAVHMVYGTFMHFKYKR